VISARQGSTSRRTLARDPDRSFCVNIDTSWVHETPTEAKVKCDIRTGNVSIESCHTEGGEIDANALAAKILYKGGLSRKLIDRC
jgi:hypothetical protein